MACVRPRSSAPRPACAKPRSTARGNPPRAQPRSGKPAGPSWHPDCDSACQGRKSQADPFLSLATKPACRSLIQCAQSKRAIFRGALMSSEKKSPREAAIRAMQEVSGPVVAIVLVLCAVFVPVSFLGGLAGELYRQFAVTIAVSVVISGLVALTL